jgi:hypothetical protein
MGWVIRILEYQVDESGFYFGDNGEPLKAFKEGTGKASSVLESLFFSQSKVFVSKGKQGQGQRDQLADYGSQVRQNEGWWKGSEGEVELTELVDDRHL